MQNLGTLRQLVWGQTLIDYIYKGLVTYGLDGWNRCKNAAGQFTSIWDLALLWLVEIERGGVNQRSSKIHLLRHVDLSPLTAVHSRRPVIIHFREERIVFPDLFDTLKTLSRVFGGIWRIKSFCELTFSLTCMLLLFCLFISELVPVKWYLKLRGYSWRWHRERMSSSEPQNQQDKSLVSVRPILQTVGRGGSIAGDGRGGVAGSGYENTLLSQLSAANSVSLRPQLVTCLPTALTASTPDRSDSCPGPVQQLLPQQHLHTAAAALRLPDRKSWLDWPRTSWSMALRKEWLPAQKWSNKEESKGNAWKEVKGNEP